MVVLSSNYYPIRLFLSPLVVTSIYMNSCFDHVFLTKMLVEKTVSVLDMDSFDCTLQGF